MRHSYFRMSYAAGGAGLGVSEGAASLHGLTKDGQHSSTAHTVCRNHPFASHAPSQIVRQRKRVPPS